MSIIILILFGGISIIIFSLAFKARREKKQKNKQLQKVLESEAAKRQLTWTESEISKNCALAWSEDRRILFFLNFDDSRLQVLDINQASGCHFRELNYQNNENNRSASDRDIHSVELEIRFKDQTVVVLPMYNEIKDGVFERINLTAKARKWEAIIQPKKQLS